MGKGSSDVALFCTFCINPIKNTSSLCLVDLVASWIEKETGATSDGTFNQKLGYLHVQHVLIKETDFFERKHIFHYKSFIGFSWRCFCSFCLVSKRFTFEFRHVLNRFSSLRDGEVHGIGITTSFNLVPRAFPLKKPWGRGCTFL